MKEARPRGPTEQLSVKYYYKWKPGSRRSKSIISETLGRLNPETVISHVLLWRPAALVRGVRPDIESYLRERFPQDNIPWRGNVLVSCNRLPLWQDIKRTWLGKKYQGEGRANLALRIFMGTPAAVFNWGGRMLSAERADYYNPWSKTVMLFHRDPHIAMHELGHAEDFARPGRKFPGIYALLLGIPGIRHRMEWRASRNAMRRLPEQEQKRAKTVLEPAFGTYLAYPLNTIPSLSIFAQLSLVAAGALAGQLHSRLGRRDIFGYEERHRPGQKELRKTLLRHETTIAREGKRQAPRAVYEKGVTLLALGRDSEALRTLKKAKRLMPQDSWTRIKLAEAYGRKGKYEKARREYAEALRINPYHPELQFYRAANKQAEAKKLFKAGEAIRPKDPLKALKFYEQAMMLVGEKDTPQSIFAKGKALLSLGRIKASIRELKKAKEFMPTSSSVNSRLGLAYEKRGSRRLARKSYKRALKIRTNNPEAIAGLRRLERL